MGDAHFRTHEAWVVQTESGIPLHTKNPAVSYHARNGIPHRAAMQPLPYTVGHRILAFLILGALCSPRAQAQSVSVVEEGSRASLNLGIGLSSYRQVDHTVSRLHYGGTLQPLRLGFETAGTRSRQSWNLHLQQIAMEGAAGNSRDYRYLRFHYFRLWRLTPSRVNGTGGIRVYAGGGAGGRFARLYQTITLPTYSSRYSSGYWAASLDVRLRADADLHNRWVLTYATELPLISYHVKPEWSRRWPGVRDGALGGPGAHLEWAHYLEVRYRLSSRLLGGLEACYVLTRLPHPTLYASTSLGASLTIGYRL